MLYIVLLLVLGALGLLVTALTTANTLWAWVSVAISVAAAAILVVDWLRHRRAPAVAGVSEAEVPDGEAQDAEVLAGAAPAVVDTTASDEQPVRDSDEPLTAPTTPPADQTVHFEPGAEPDEEQTDAADLLVVSGLAADVRVLDERPRYHLTKCAWLGGRSSIPLPVSEARTLGFTPCAVCSPDATLAAKHRAGRGARTGQ